MKALHVIFITLAFLLLASPAVLMPFFSDAVNTEKRELSEFPALYDGEWNDDFSEELNTWVQEHIGLRNQMVSANSLLRSRLFGQSATETVIVGKDGWLYYSDTVNDYLHVRTLSERNVRCVVRTLAMLRDYAVEQGSAFVVALIPNKNSLYGDAMPWNYRPLPEENNLSLLTKALEEEGIRVAGAEEALRNEGRVLYQKTDSHWTYEGALAGYRAIMEASGMEYERFETLSFRDAQDWPADLAVSLYGEAAQPEWQRYPDIDFTYEYTSRAPAVDAITLTTAKEGGTGNLVMYRDSFANTMQVYFAESFETACFSRALPYQAELIGRHQADLTVLEIVERNLIHLAERAPLMPAPCVLLEADAQVMPEESAQIFAEQSGSYLHLYGTIDEALLGPEYRVFLLAEKDGETLAYEAFPIFEKELLGNEKTGDNGWSLYLAEDDVSGAALSLLADTGGRALCIPLTMPQP